MKTDYRGLKYEVTSCQGEGSFERPLTNVPYGFKIYEEDRVIKHNDRSFSVYLSAEYHAKGYIDEYQRLAGHVDLLRDVKHEGNHENERTDEMTQDRCISLYNLLDGHTDETLGETATLIHDIIQHEDDKDMSLKSLMYLMRAYTNDVTDCN